VSRHVREPIGAVVEPGGGATFRLWAPNASAVELALTGRGERLAMRRQARGYWFAHANASAGDRYAYSVDGGPLRPDPASRHQPEGPHEPSALDDSGFAWTDGAWKNPSLSRHVFYELHVGAFTPEGTFDGAIERLDHLRELGVTALQVMPIAEFPGARNWGYDGVSLFAAHSAYGGPHGFRRLVDAAHGAGLAVYLDVVYNHLGPEGNYLRDFGPYFTDRYRTPWGEALNFDGHGSDGVRNFFIENALHWTREMHVDGLRLDAVHAIVDPTASPFVRELAEAVRERAAERGRVVHVIAEDASNDPRVTAPARRNGFACDAQWNDDFHHALRAALSGDRRGYYSNFGEARHVARAYANAFVLTGQASAFHGRRHGAAPVETPDWGFVVFSQNHDQVGNRLLGERLGENVPFEALKLAAAATLLSPYAPMLFMGEEFAASARFPYFVSHTDEKLAEAVRKGRAEEFAAFGWEGEPPDPQSESTFRSAKLDWDEAGEGEHAVMLELHRELLALRRRFDLGGLNDRGARDVWCDERAGVVAVRRRARGGEVALLLNLSGGRAEAPVAGSWDVELDTAASRWGGSGAAGGALALAPWSGKLLARRESAAGQGESSG